MEKLTLKRYVDPDKRKPVMATLEIVPTQVTVETIPYKQEAQQLYAFLYSNISAGTWNELHAIFTNGYKLDVR